MRKVHLDIGENHISVEGSRKIGLALKSIKNLNNLYLKIGHKNFIGQGAVEIGEGLSTLTNLEELTIVILDIIGLEGIVKLCSGIQNLINLTSLSF